MKSGLPETTAARPNPRRGRHYLLISATILEPFRLPFEFRQDYQKHRTLLPDERTEEPRADHRRPHFPLSRYRKYRSLEIADGVFGLRTA
jgi:hypothetical protein